MRYVKITVILHCKKKEIYKKHYEKLLELRDFLYSNGVFDIDWVGNNVKLLDLRDSDVVISFGENIKFKQWASRSGAMFIDSSFSDYLLSSYALNKVIENVIKIRSGTESAIVDSEMPLLYHLSFNNNLPLCLEPRQPDGTDPGSELVENLPPRVSFSSSIEGCFRAITPNILEVINKSGRRPLTMHAYLLSAKTTKRDMLSPAELTDINAIKDANFTAEYCFMKKVFVRRFAVLDIFPDTKKKIFYKDNGGKVGPEDTSWGYDISYQVVKSVGAAYINTRKYELYFNKII